jgi:hypothetical protein
VARKPNKNWPYIKLDGRPAVATQVKNPMAIKGDQIEYRRSGAETWSTGTVTDVTFVGSTRLMSVSTS